MSETQPTKISSGSVHRFFFFDDGHEYSPVMIELEPVETRIDSIDDFYHRVIEGDTADPSPWGILAIARAHAGECILTENEVKFWRGRKTDLCESADYGQFMHARSNGYVMK